MCDGRQNGYNFFQYMSKVELIWELVLNQEFTGFPAKIWIFRFFFLMVLAIKKHFKNNAYGLLNLLEFIYNHFNSLFQVESELKSSIFGEKSSELLIKCQFPNKFDISRVGLKIRFGLAYFARDESDF